MSERECVIYDAKTDTLYEALYDAESDVWELWYKDDEVIISAETVPGVVFDKKCPLIFLGEL